MVMTNEDLAEILKLHHEGLSIRKIAKRTGWAYSSIGRCLRKLGYGVKPRIGEDVIAQFKPCIDKGMTAKQIAKKFEISTDTVFDYLGRDGHSIPKGPKMPQSITIPTNKIKLAYLAGFIDADGGIYKRGNNQGKAIVSVFNNNRDVMDWIKKEIGGNYVNVHKERNLRNGHSPSYQWYVTRANDVKALLSAILPYMIVKQERARDILALFP